MTVSALLCLLDCLACQSCPSISIVGLMECARSKRLVLFKVKGLARPS